MRSTKANKQGWAKRCPACLLLVLLYFLCKQHFYCCYTFSFFEFVIFSCVIQTMFYCCCAFSFELCFFLCMMQMRLLYIYTLRQTRTAQEYEKNQEKGHQAEKMGMPKRTDRGVSYDKKHKRLTNSNKILYLYSLFRFRRNVRSFLGEDHLGYCGAKCLKPCLTEFIFQTTKSPSKK